MGRMFVCEVRSGGQKSREALRNELLGIWLNNAWLVRRCLAALCRRVRGAQRSCAYLADGERADVCTRCAARLYKGGRHRR